MIPTETLLQLVPAHDPEDDYPRDNQVISLDRDNPTRRIALWSAYLRHRISAALPERSDLRVAVAKSGFLATGIFRTPSRPSKEPHSGFNVVDGYQFGAALLLSQALQQRSEAYYSSIQLQKQRYSAPIIQSVAHFNLHASEPDGHTSAYFRDDDGTNCGITAGHVVGRLQRGQRVPISCSLCGHTLRLARKAPGLIDAAALHFPCDCPEYMYPPGPATVRSAREGEVLWAHFGNTGSKECTVTMALQTPSEVICAATPKHFLIDTHGHPGDSGSLIAVSQTPLPSQELVGMYLGEADCEDSMRNQFTYGYAIDLKQAAYTLDATILAGEFNV